MSFPVLPMNLNGLQNISSPNISVSGSDVFSNVIGSANSLTDNLLVFFSLGIIGMIVYMVLTDQTQWQDFGYDYIRGLNISLNIMVLLGACLVEVAWSPNFYAIGLFTTLWFITYIIILIIDNKE